MRFRPWPVAIALVTACSPGEGPEAVRSSSEPLQECVYERIEGIDVFDGQGLIDWDAVATAGIAFAFIKATQGTYDTQATFAYNWVHAGRAGLARGAYHFFDPTEDGVAQADHFLSVVGALALDDLPAMLDIECPDGSGNCLFARAPGSARPADIASRMRVFLRTVEGATGKPPILYTFPAYFRSNGIDTAGLGRYPLAVASPGAHDCFPVPAPWMKATLWQYSWGARIRGIPEPVDRDRFLGTLSDLRALATARSPTSPSGLVSIAAPIATPIATGTATATATAGPSTPQSGCEIIAAPTPSDTAPPLAMALAIAHLLRTRRKRKVAGRPSRVLAGADDPPCRRPTSARA